MALARQVNCEDSCTEDNCNDVGKANAAGALKNLAVTSENAIAIVAAEGIPEAAMWSPPNNSRRAGLTS